MKIRWKEPGDVGWGIVVGLAVAAAGSWIGIAAGWIR